MLDLKLPAILTALTALAAAAVACRGQSEPPAPKMNGIPNASSSKPLVPDASSTPSTPTTTPTPGTPAMPGALTMPGSSSAPDAASTSAYWQPHPGTSWQIQLQGTVDTGVAASAYDIDLFDNPASTMAALHAAGRKVICYFSAGSYENWRPDAGQFPAAALGNGLVGWPGENWLDTRSAAVRTIMQARMDMAVTKGCDAVDPDNVDGYTNNPGFPLTAATQLDYNMFLATSAHARGLGVGLKNDLDQVTSLVGSFDFAVNEQCEQYAECDLLKPFIAANKPVFGIEYQGTVSSVCPTAIADDFDTLLKTLALDATRTSCR